MTSNESGPTVDAAGGLCTYAPEVTGTVSVTNIEPIEELAPTSFGATCRRVDYTWTTGGPSKYANFDALFATDACVASAGIGIGTTFTVTRMDEATGDCTPSLRTIEDTAIGACAAACESE